ncbi:MAG: hypothetical protein A2802_02605 [Candidatus Woykebacteria bacterium RIFCSPHIGHO2_01_FULL_43_29]|uniref:Glycosyl transferase family 1 domain-containing protein n=1 Tax=Candidatus Woykebacteria bacterium RIFCSPHIGHO2_02_FULL_43_16b TaxID=1802601 RepID=A0A1G1WPX2_9BACT|nr:MAG: hypothetical protein A2802_02605 [Candidatus Woykebacteria bacterium RIFCSPHIGHO2_01_FULL_43_29]OGY29749.1 MAG: hypothetical protein A3J50_00820 [Candidatus Woykebacteria bacterium RIFCSPHIGHO2_02_FULL_43_16b]
MIKVLISSHAYIVGLNQQKLESLARNKDLELSLLVPKKWRSVLREISLEKVDDPGYSIYPTAAFFQGKNDRFFYNPFDLLKVFHSVGPDVVHIEEEPWSVACLELMLAAKLFGAKALFFTWENLSRSHKPWYGLIERINLFLADGAIAGNSEAKVVLETKGFRRPVIVLPQLGIDLETFKKTNPEKVKKELGLKGFVIGFVGRLDPQKGIKDLVTSAQKLSFDWQLFIVGNGPLKEWVETESKKDPRMLYYGVADHSDMPKLFNAMDVFVLPSVSTEVWKEQFGHTLIEAMATQVPVIGSNSGAIPEVIGEAGLIFKEGNVEDLSEKIKQVYEDKKLRKDLSSKGLERVKNHYTHQEISSQTLPFYKSL